MSGYDVSHYQTILVINTTEQQKTEVALIHKGSVSTFSQPVRAQELQKLALQLLEKTGLAFTDLRALAVLTGPGSLTGIRIGVTTTNTLALLLSIPIIRLDGTDITQAISDIQNKKELEIERLLTVVEQG